MPKLDEFRLDNPLDTKAVRPASAKWWGSMILGGVVLIAALVISWNLFQFVWAKLTGFVGSATGFKIPGLSTQAKPASGNPAPASPVIRVWS